MKKHLVAFLSMIGLAGSVAPAQGQVLKGKDNASTTNESKIKASKQKHEKNAIKQENTQKDRKSVHADLVSEKGGKLKAEKNATNVQIQDKRKDKWMKADAEHKASKNAAEIKASKNAAEHKHMKQVDQTSPK